MQADKFNILDNLEELKKVDKSDMLGVVGKTPDMLQEAFDAARRIALRRIKGVKQIVICGMGGSAIAGDIVFDLLAGRIKIPIFINRGYKIPAFAENKTLFFALSYSGNTEETLSAVNEAQRCGAEIICVTSGGKLREIAEKKAYPLYLIPSGYEPRAALPYLLIPVLKVLEKKKVFMDFQPSISESIALLRGLNEEYGILNPLKKNPVKRLAAKLSGRIPIVFAVDRTTGAAGLRLKTQLNENGKITALFNVFPELGHNEIVNLSVLKREEHDFSIIFLRDPGDPERIKKGMEIVKSLIGRQLGGVNEICSQGKSHFARIMSLIFFGDYLSCYLAVLQGIDPTLVDVIARFKKEMAR